MKKPSRSKKSGSKFVYDKAGARPIAGVAFPCSTIDSVLRRRYLCSGGAAIALQGVNSFLTYLDEAGG